MANIQKIIEASKVAEELETTETSRNEERTSNSNSIVGWKGLLRKVDEIKFWADKGVEGITRGVTTVGEGISVVGGLTRTGVGTAVTAVGSTAESAAKLIKGKDKSLTQEEEIYQDEERQRRIKTCMDRVDDFLANKLTPFEEKEETQTEKALRLGKVAFSFAKGAAAVVPMAGYLRLLIQGTHLGLTFGAMGVGAWMLREDMKDSVNTVLKILGRVPGVGVQDLAGGLYYMFAVQRGHRGCNPELDFMSHSDCQAATEALLLRFISLAPLALTLAYESSFSVQRGVRLRGERLVLAEQSDAKEQATFYLSGDTETKTATLVVTGTKGLQDICTDVNALERPFVAVNEHGDLVEGFAHSGIAQAACWLVDEVGPCLAALIHQGFRVVVVGHSLGGGVAALLTMWIRQADKKVGDSLECFAYCPPPCACAKLSRAAKSYVHSLVNGDDIIPRASLQNVVGLVEDLQALQPQAWHSAVEEDVRAVYKRFVLELGAPRIRRADRSEGQLSAASDSSAGNTNDNSNLEEEADYTNSVDPWISTSEHNQTAGDHQEAASDDSFMSSPSCVHTTNSYTDDDLSIQVCLEFDPKHGNEDVKVHLRVNRQILSNRSRRSRSFESCSSFKKTEDFVHCTLEIKKLPTGQEVVRVRLVSQEQRRMFLYVPGTIVHIYKSRGQHLAAMVPQDHACLSRLELSTSLVDDHRGFQVYLDLLDTVNALRSNATPPEWVPYNQVETCMVCGNDFGWNASLANIDDLQKMRHRHHCTNCGQVVCGACSSRKAAVPRLGIVQTPCRLCDCCYFGWGKSDHAFV